MYPIMNRLPDARFTTAIRGDQKLDMRRYAPLASKLTPHPVGDHAVLENLRLVDPIMPDQIVRQVNARIASLEAVAAPEGHVIALAAAAREPSASRRPERRLAEVGGGGRVERGRLEAASPKTE